MKELTTKALVLNIRPAKHMNRSVSLFTEELGKIDARVIGGLKSTSKLTPHLNPGNIATIRVAIKNQHTITDALEEESLFKVNKGQMWQKKVLDFLFLLDKVSPHEEPDLRLWQEINQSLKQKEIHHKIILQILGYDASLASCSSCGKKEVSYFRVTDHTMTCKECHKKRN